MAKQKQANKSNSTKMKGRNSKRAQQEVHASNKNEGVNIRGGKKAAMHQQNKTSNNEFNTNFQPKVGSNDPSWYNLTPSMVATGANISYNTALGIEQALPIVAGGAHPTAGVQSSVVKTNLPGIMTIEMMPTAGTATDAGSALNLAGRSIFATIRRSINGTRNYEYTDVMNYILTVGSMYSYVALLMRAISATRTLTLLNRYSREHLITAMGFNARDLIENTANYLFKLNSIIKQLNLLPIPKDITLFERWVWLNTNIFLDEEGPKAQMYIPNLRYWYDYQYNDKPGPNRGPVSLVPETHQDGERFGTMLNMLEYTIGKLNQDTDIATIGGDILRTYGMENMHALPILDEIVPVVPTVDEEWKAQMHNLVVAPVKIKSIDTVVDTAAENTYLECVFEDSKTTRPVINHMTLLDTEHSLPTPMDNMLISRLATTLEKDEQNGKVTVKAMGSELPVGIKVYILEPGAGSLGLAKLQVEAIDQVADYLRDQISDYELSKRLRQVSLLSHFKVTPFLYNYIILSEDNPQISDFTLIGDVNTYAWVDDQVITNMHQTAVYSQLGLGEYGKGLLHGNKD